MFFLRQIKVDWHCDTEALFKISLIRLKSARSHQNLLVSFGLCVLMNLSIVSSSSHKFFHWQIRTVLHCKWLREEINKKRTSFSKIEIYGSNDQWVSFVTICSVIGFFSVFQPRVHLISISDTFKMPKWRWLKAKWTAHAKKWGKKTIKHPNTKKPFTDGEKRVELRCASYRRSKKRMNNKNEDEDTTVFSVFSLSLSFFPFFLSAASRTRWHNRDENAADNKRGERVTAHSNSHARHIGEETEEHLIICNKHLLA